MTLNKALTSSVATSTDVPVAVSYLRVSTKEQAERDGDPEGYSIPAQREANSRKAANLGSVIDREFIDRGESARSADRPQLKAMLAYLKTHPEVSYVIVHKVDRLARNRMDDVEINLALSKAGVTLVSATENIDETPSGMLLHGIMSSIAEFYSRNLATEVLKGMNQKVKTGGTPGRPPLGYRNTRATNSEGREVRTIELDPERAPLIRWAFTAYATGDWTLVQLLTELERRGLTNTPTPKFSQRPLRLSHLYKILTHPYYKGEVLWKGVSYPGRHPILVSVQTWNDVQAVLQAHGPGEKQRIHQHYLKSTVYCGSCGSRLVISNAKNRYGAIYPYFICVGRHQKRTTCTRKATLTYEVEALIEDFYATVQLDADLRTDIERTVRAELAESNQAAEAEVAQLSTQQQRLTHERAKLLQAHYAGAVPLDLLKSEQNRISRQLDGVENRLSAISTDYELIASRLTTTLDLLGNCQRAYLAADTKTRRLLNQGLFEQLFIDERGVRAAVREPFATLAGPEVLSATGRLGGTAEDEQLSQDQRPTPAVSQLWDAAYIRLMRSRRPSSWINRGERSKQLPLVRPKGFEPLTS